MTTCLADSLSKVLPEHIQPESIQPENTPAPWYLYLVRCVDGSLYAGISLDPERRCMEHNQQRSRASRYVWARRPAHLVWQREVADQSQALKLELRLKRLTKVKKEQLLLQDNGWQALLAQIRHK
ncbi:endonuclease [Oceanisphaera profunda]|uniref:Endonuclease n=1 Tax=Oceanisphaera profunda TaxID=1416627 RepID=A0A1Y0D681_9GAMM|nr:endonuclease [Oceanisphaera profunda]